MSKLGLLLQRTGDWQGTNRLILSETAPPEESAATARITPLLGGRFVRLDYTWGYRGEPQEGSLLIGHEAKAGDATAHWIDSWHMGDKVMTCRGAAAENGTLTLRGFYAAPPDRDWGWHTVLEAGEGETWRMVMYNVTPDGDETLAVDAAFTHRAG